MSHFLSRFFAPRSVAFIGATEDLSKFGGRCMRQLIDFGFVGAIHPINPRREEVFGRRCYPSLAALPQVPDHVGIVLPSGAVAGERPLEVEVNPLMVLPAGRGVRVVDALVVARKGDDA